MPWRISLVARLAVIMALLVVAGVASTLLLVQLLPEDAFTAGLLAVLIVAPAVVISARGFLQPMLAMFRALGGTVTSYRDADYAFSLHWPRNDEMGDLVEAHNELGDVLREQRLDLIQRELLLDTMVQNTPVAMLLAGERGVVVFANLAARQLLNQGRRLEGHSLDSILETVAGSLREAVSRGGDGLFTVRRRGRDEMVDEDRDGDDEDEIYHLSRRKFSLNGSRHELLLLRQLTAELRRQEVQTWKKVIRVISHELNNSLAPVGSLANSGIELVRRGQTERLPEVLGTIADRTRHLENFIAGYARFAKLPTPRRETITWLRFVGGLQTQMLFHLSGGLPEEPTNIDVAQMEQALLNLLKNAHESGSPPAQVVLSVRKLVDVVVIEIADRGAGMSETVMAHALVPFYSTKRSGTGLGLALAREIVEAHGGRITLANREGGGLAVALVLPL